VNTDCAGGAACAAGTCGAPVSLAVSATPYGTTHARVRFAASNFTPGTFTLYRSTAVGTTGTAVATPAGTAQEYMDSGLSVGTTYYYKVAASGPQATVSSPQAKATTEAAAAFTAKPTGFLTTWVPPANPRELGYVHLQWDAYPGANIYEVYRTPVAELVGDQQFTKLLGIPTATSFDDGAVVKGVVYHYFVIAHDTIGGRVSAPAAISVGAPGMPLFCEAPIVDTVSSSPDVHYAHLYFWGGAGATEHHVYVSTDPAVITPVQGGTGAPLDGAPNSLAITEVRPGYFRMNIPWATLASYGVGATVHVAVEGWRVTANSHAPSTGHASFVVQDVPSVNISDLIATRLNPHAVQLSWTAPAIIGLSGYDIYRLATPTEAPSGANLLATQGSTGFTDTTASPGTYYYYQVFAKKSRLAFPSNVAAVKTFSDWAPLLLPPYSFAFTGVAYLGWSSFNDGTTFRVYGGTALLDNPDFIGNLASLVGVTLSPQPPVATFVDFGMTVGGAEITIPSADLDATRLSLFSMRLFGQWWVSEVYPDGTESAKAATIPILIF
jgi:fibronectin type 3 domain-containing protein